MDTHLRWPNALTFTGLRKGKSLSDYGEEIAYLQSFITARIAWFDRAFPKPD
jgi:hypothetical protein